MKTCPTCHRSYTDDSLSFCLEDGTPLTKAEAPPAFDPQATVQYDSVRETSPPPTQVYVPPQTPPVQQPAPVIQPQAPPPPPQPSWTPPSYTPGPAPQKKGSALPWIIGIVGVIVVLGGGGILLVVLFTLMDSNTNGNTSNTNLGNTNISSNRNAGTNTNKGSQESNENTGENGAIDPTASALISSVELARDNGAGSNGATVSSFSPTDNPIHVVVKLTDGSGGIRLTAELVAVNISDGKNGSWLKIPHVTENGQDAIDFKATLPRAWPTGDYKWDIYVNGKLGSSTPFTIE